MKQQLDSIQGIVSNNVIYSTEVFSNNITSSEVVSNNNLHFASTENQSEIFPSIEENSNNNLVFAKIQEQSEEIFSFVENIVSNNQIYSASILNNQSKASIDSSDVLENLYSKIIQFCEVYSSNKINSVNVLNSNKSLIEYVDILSEISILISKISEEMTFQEIKQFFVQKSLSDIISATETTVYDLIKPRKELIEISNNVYFYYEKVISEQFSILDNAELLFTNGRLYSDNPQSVEILSFNISKIVSDNYDVKELISKIFNKPFVENFELTDYRNKSLNKAVFDYSKSYESSFFNVQKSINQISNIEEIFTISLEKFPIYDELYSYDTYSLNPNKIRFEEIKFSENKTKNFTKILQGYFIPQEYISNHFQKYPFFDENHIHESVVIFLQTYSANSSYFAGNYVGQQSAV